MSSQTIDRASVHNPYTYISSQPRYRDDADAAQESVDLLQMVPDRSRSDSMPRAASQGSKVHCTTASPRRMRMILLPSDTEGEEESTNPMFHTCGHGCSRDSSIYYSRVNSGPPGPSTASTTLTSAGTQCVQQENSRNERDDGSVYFNYLQFNKTRTNPPHAYGSHPSLYTHHKHVNCGEATKEYFKCCRKNTNLRSNSTSKLYSHFSKSFKRKSADPAETGTDNATYGASQSKLKKRREWTRIKRLMFLVGILIGIVIALGGLVIGFLVLAPKHTGKSPFFVLFEQQINLLHNNIVYYNNNHN